MIYQQVEELTKASVSVIQGRLEMIEQEVAAKIEAIKIEDSRKREQKLREEVKLLRQERQTLWHEQEAIQLDVFKKLLQVEYGVIGNPRFEMAFGFAWDYGHSSGFSEVENYFMSLVELIK